ncbi:hypothetical protein AB9H16_22310, partial [Pseudomonas protegens]
GLNIWLRSSVPQLNLDGNLMFHPYAVKAAQFAAYKPESKGKSAKVKHPERLYACTLPATFRPMDENGHL